MHRAIEVVHLLLYASLTDSRMSHFGKGSNTMDVVVDSSNATFVVVELPIPVYTEEPLLPMQEHVSLMESIYGEETAILLS